MMPLYVYVFVVMASCIFHPNGVGGTVKNDREMLLFPFQATDKKQNMLEFQGDEMHLWSPQPYIFCVNDITHTSNALDFILFDDNTVNDRIV